MVVGLPRQSLNIIRRRRHRFLIRKYFYDVEQCSNEVVLTDKRGLRNEVVFGKHYYIIKTT